MSDNDTKALLDESRDIYERAVEQYDPYATVLMFSGGNDSQTAAEVALALGIDVDYVIHGVTGTGIPETTKFARRIASRYAPRYAEADAGDAYEKYVLRKGFFGRGRTAHTYAYHVLKAGEFRKAISRNIRKRKRGRTVLMLNGARLDESDNRKHNLTDVYNEDPSAKSNVWVNLIHHWPASACRDFVGNCGVARNPVTEKLCRSGECMCGTMQSPAEREEAAFYYPSWGAWLDDLERRVFERGFTWRWGEDVSDYHIQKWNGQMELDFPDFQPACVSCKRESLFEKELA